MKSLIGLLAVSIASSLNFRRSTRQISLAREIMLGTERSGYMLGNRHPTNGQRPLSINHQIIRWLKQSNGTTGVTRTKDKGYY